MRSKTKEPRAFVTLELGHESEYIAVGAGENIKPADRARTRYRVYNSVNPHTIHVPRDFNPDTDTVVVGRGNKDGVVVPPARLSLPDLLCNETGVASIRLADGAEVKVRIKDSPDYRVSLEIEE